MSPLKHGHKLARLYVLKQREKELHRAADPGTCFSHLAIMYPNMTMRAAMDFGFKIEPFICSGHSLDDHGICTKCGWAS